MALTLHLRRCRLRTCTVPVIFAHVDKLHSVVLVFQRDKTPFRLTLRSQMLGRTCSAKILLRRFRMERSFKERTLPSFSDSSLNLGVISLSALAQPLPARTQTAPSSRLRRCSGSHASSHIRSC